MTKKLLALSFIVALVGLPFPVVRADDSDIFISGTAIQPNVMILIDTSGSMLDTILADPYDANATYTGTYTGAWVYQWFSQTTCTGNYPHKVCTTTSGYSKYAGSVSGVTDTKSATNQANAQNALNTQGYFAGTIGGSPVQLYVGSYLNWTATPGNTMTAKIDIAKTVITNLVQSTHGVLFGLATYKNDTHNETTDGANIIAPIPSDSATLINAIKNINTNPKINPNWYTPLGEALRDLGTYYKGGSVHGTTYAKPIRYPCQANFIILMTDGMQNGAVTDKTATGGDVVSQATYRHNEGRIVSTIGFNLTAAEKSQGADTTLQAAAKNGGGTYYETDSEKQLEAALQDAMRKIAAATFSFATPTIPTTSATGTNRAYMAAFQSSASGPFWRGYLKAFNRYADGTLKYKADNKTPDDSAGCTLAPDPAHPEVTVPCLAWEAGNVLAGTSPGSRTLYTKLSGTGASLDPFDTDHVTDPTLFGLSSGDTATLAKILNFIRGVDTYDENGNGNTTEDRAWKLGDIFHSTPVLVPPPFQALADDSYTTFKTTWASRTTILLVGANDGMLHAFKESDGTELWAFVPPAVLGRLQLLTDTSQSHTFFVDSSPIVADVKIGGAWKTIVVFGLRRGGNDYYALDITDTTNPQWLWDFDDPAIAESWSEPVIGKVPTGNYVAIFGGGYDTANNNLHGAALFVVDVSNGTTLWKYAKTSGATDDRQYMNFSIPADVTALDLNMDGFIDRLYVGDVGGHVWKFDLSTTDLTNWTGKRLFTADATIDNRPNNCPPAGECYPLQAIYGAIIPALDDQKNLWLYFGTGDRNHPNNTTAPNRFYGIKDNTTMANGSALTEASLVDLTSTNATVTQGFYIKLGTSEKILAAADVFNKIVYFTTFTPFTPTSDTTTSCDSGGGTANLYALQMLTGYAALDWNNSATPLTTTNASVARGTQIGTGIPSKPMVIITESGTTISTSVIAATTSQQLPSNPTPPPSFMRKVLYWREVF